MLTLRLSRMAGGPWGFPKSSGWKGLGACLKRQHHAKRVGSAWFLPYAIATSDLGSGVTSEQDGAVPRFLSVALNRDS